MLFQKQGTSASWLILLIVYASLLFPTGSLGFEFGQMPSFLSADSQDATDATAKKRGPLEAIYEPVFAAFSRSIIGRAPPGIIGLLNNVKEDEEISPGSTKSFVFEWTRITNGKEGATEDSSSSSSERLLKVRGGEDVCSMEDTCSDEDGDSTTDEVDDSNLQRRRQDTKKIFISATTCEQPERKGDSVTMDPPQMSLFVSTSSDNQKPGPDADMSKQDYKGFIEGAVTYTVETTGDVFFGVHAPTSNDDMFDGGWKVEVAVSTDEFYHYYDGNASTVSFVNSDSTGALLQTPDLTTSLDGVEVEQIMSGGPQYMMFVDTKDSLKTRGVRHSLCGLRNYASMSTKLDAKFGDNATTTLTTRGVGGHPKQQFHFNKLTANTKYEGILVKVGHQTRKRQQGNVAGGGGQVFDTVDFETKTGDNCRVITNLDFCNETEYAVPANEDNFNLTALASFYDDYAKEMFDNFKKQLAQIPCDAPATERYSLARDCEDCEQAYKRWLCTVTIPLCEDFTGTNPYSQVRNLDQPFPNGSDLPSEIRESQQFVAPHHRHSRMERIDEQVQPGPYKEIMPCNDLCHELVRSCPAKLDFQCPKPNRSQFNGSYAERGEEGELRCNAPPSTPSSGVLGTSTGKKSAATGVIVSWSLVSAMAALAALGAILL